MVINRQRDCEHNQTTIRPPCKFSDGALDRTSIFPTSGLNSTPATVSGRSLVFAILLPHGMIGVGSGCLSLNVLSADVRGSSHENIRCDRLRRLCACRSRVGSVCVRNDRAAHRMGEHERAGVQGSVCTTAILTRQCPLWVKSRHRSASSRCPLYPRKRTLVEPRNRLPRR